LERTGVLKGFIIFLMATDAPVSWSFAELNGRGRNKGGRRRGNGGTILAQKLLRCHVKSKLVEN